MPDVGKAEVADEGLEVVVVVVEVNVGALERLDDVATRDVCDWDAGEVEIVVVEFLLIMISANVVDHVE